MAAIAATSDIWLAAGVRTPFSKLDGPLAHYDAIELSTAVADTMLAQAEGPVDLAVWGAVAPNLAWSNIAREVLLEAGGDPAIPAFSTIMAREDEDRLALESHKRAVAAWRIGFFEDLVIPLPELAEDSIPRSDTSLEVLSRLPLVFDRTSGKGTLTAGNSSPLSDGAAGVW